MIYLDILIKDSRFDVSRIEKIYNDISKHTTKPFLHMIIHDVMITDGYSQELAWGYVLGLMSVCSSGHDFVTSVLVWSHCGNANEMYYIELYDNLSNNGY